jgi:hypothetical protein
MPSKLWNFLNSEKLMKASTSRPDTIVAEIRGRYDKMDSTIFIVENSVNQIFALNPRRI